MDSSTRLAAGTEDPKTSPPVSDILLAAAATLPIAGGIIALFLTGDPARATLTRLTLLWAGSVLCFLAGVRRGIAFRQEGGPTLGQLASMFVLFCFGAAAVLTPARPIQIVLLIAGWALLGMFDSIAAQRREAPRYFRILRPVQVAVAIVPLAALLIGRG